MTKSEKEHLILESNITGLKNKSTDLHKIAGKLTEPNRTALAKIANYVHSVAQSLEKMKLSGGDSCQS